MNYTMISQKFDPKSGGIQNTSFLFANELALKASDKDKIQIIYIEKGDSLLNKKIQQMKSYSPFSLNPIKIIKHIMIHLKIRKYTDLNILFHYSLGLSSLFLKIVYRIPFVVLVYGNDVYNSSTEKGLFRNIKYKFRSIILKNAKYVFACSNFTSGLAKKIINDEHHKKIVTIHPPIKFNSNYTNYLSKDKPVLFSIGRIVERKGFQNVIKSLSHLIQRYPDLEYKIAGDGDYKNALQKLVKELNLESNVTFLGKITEEEKIEHFSTSKIFIMPSYSIKYQNSVEGFGIVYLEANMFGKFVIGSRDGGIPEAIIENKTGFLVKPNDVQDLTKKIDTILSFDFIYYEDDCIDWAKQHDIKIILEKYLKYFNKSYLS